MHLVQVVIQGREGGRGETETERERDRCILLPPAVLLDVWLTCHATVTHPSFPNWRPPLRASLSFQNFNLRFLKWVKLRWVERVFLN